MPTRSHPAPPAARVDLPALSQTSSSGSDGSLVRTTATHLTYSRHHLVDTARETVKISEDGRYTNPQGRVVSVKEALDHAVEHCVHYAHEFDFHAALQRHDCGGGGHHRGGSLASVDELDGPRAQDRRASAPAGRFDVPAAGGPRFPRTSFLVVAASWLESASALLTAPHADGVVKVGVLNSGSGTAPGGRFLKGTVSQEDCLCRVSLLYPCLSQPRFQCGNRFYARNRSLKYGSSSCLIFSPDVPVIREDNVEGKLLDDYEKVSFVTIPAPNAFTTSSNTGREYNDNESHEREQGLTKHARVTSAVDLAALDADDVAAQLERKRTALLAALADRIHRALAACVLGGCTDLVLPAFGCGVHGNDPAMVARVFREMLTDRRRFGGRFRTVVFAIPPSRKQNYQAFAAYFHRVEGGE